MNPNLLNTRGPWFISPLLRNFPHTLHMMAWYLTNSTLQNAGESPKVVIIGNQGPDRQYTYVTRSIDSIPKPPGPIPPVACNCLGDCTADCSCIRDKENNFDNDSGLLTYHQRPIYECGPYCSCKPQICKQRVRPSSYNHE